jgi:hypothetical protein
MKALVRKSGLKKLIALACLLYFEIAANGQANTLNKESNIRDFEITISSYNFPVRPFATIFLKNNELTICKKVRVAIDKDTILFDIKLNPTDTLKTISEINLANLKNYYSNNCIDDGSQIMLF